MGNTEIKRIDAVTLMKAATLIQNGGIIGCPTDIIYGLATNPFNNESVEEIFKIKQRDPNQQIILLVNQNYDIDVLVEEVTPVAKKLMANFWPGPLTLIFKNKARFSKLVTGKANTVALRVPDNPYTLKLLSFCKIPITSTSANKAGAENPITAQQVLDTFRGEIPLILDGGRSKFARASTIVDVTTPTPRIVREGAISKETISKVLGISF